MSVIVASIKANLKSSLMSYTNAELADIGSLFCQFPLHEIKTLTKVFFMLVWLVCFHFHLSFSW